MCLKAEQLKSIKDKKIIIKEFDSIIDRKDFIINFINDNSIKDNKKVWVINSTFSINIITNALIKKNLKIKNTNNKITNELWKEIKIVLDKLSNAKLRISYTSEMSLQNLLIKCNNAKEEKQNVDFIVIDDISNLTDLQYEKESLYAQNIKTLPFYIEQKEKIYKELNKVANNLNIPIIVIFEKCKYNKINNI